MEKSQTSIIVFFLAIWLLGHEVVPEPEEDKQTLINFLSTVPHMARLQWNETDSVCNWIGVECDDNRSFVTALRLPAVGLVGEIPARTLGGLTGLRVLSLRSNRIAGEIPADFSNLTLLRNVYLQNNELSGGFPLALAGLNRLVRVDLSSNNLTGSIPVQIGNLTHLTGLFLQHNEFNGNLPSGIPTGLVDFNVSKNKLNGSIPRTLARFSPDSFRDNLGLCGNPLPGCRPFFPSAASPPESVEHSRSRKLSTGAIVAISIGAGLLFLLLLLIILLVLRRRQKRKPTELPMPRTVADEATASTSKEDVTGASLENERNKLVFVAGGVTFDLEDLLRASAEVLGKGSLGTSYKAVLEEGTIVVVKRLKDVHIAKNEFEQKMQVLGRIRHENVVSLRAFYYSKDEKLLVYDYISGGSLSSLLHGGGRLSLDWGNRMRVARGAARGMACLHASDLVHGNIRSSNVLLHARDGAYDCCLTDFGLHAMFPAEKGAAEYTAPEAMETRRMTSASDVYSFGVLLLELLTGRSPVVQSTGETLDLPRWVRSVVREEWTAEVFDVEMVRSSSNEEHMVQLLQIAMACVAMVPDQRPSMQEVLRVIETVNQSQSDDGQRRSFDPSGPSEGHTPPT